ncbi:hypothetical protein [Haliea sp. E17]|uniref:hypothetical protein n=1 Tax=Haliea sp. E17 TaxID=3401576 RepID=UPI003AAF9197
MSRLSCLQTLCLGVLCATLALTLPAPEAVAKSDKHSQGSKNDNRGQQDKQNQRNGKDKEQKQMSAQQASAQAQSRYGGRVLKVEPRGSGYNVRLLQNDGRVITVFIGD